MASSPDDELSSTEVWRELKKTSQHLRAKNRVNSAEILKQYQTVHADLKVETRNDGAHLIVRYRDRVVDFWPGTGLWIDRERRGVRMRGVYLLLRELGLGRLQ